MGSDPPSERAYFEAIESLFIQLRGAPLLLSPADWRVAEDWYRRGIPFPLVERALVEVFERRVERGARGRVQSLRYCAPAVEAAWSAVRELTAPARRRAVRAFSTETRLEALANELPSGLADRQRWRERVLSLRGSSEEIEGQLAALDEELFDSLLRELGEADRTRLEAEVERALARHSARLTQSERPRVARRLLRQRLRQELKLPVLSLFGVE